MKNRVEIDLPPSSPRPNQLNTGFIFDKKNGGLILVTNTYNPDCPYVRICLEDMSTLLWNVDPFPDTYPAPLPPGTKITITIGEE